MSFPPTARARIVVDRPVSEVFAALFQVAGGKGWTTAPHGSVDVGGTWPFLKTTADGSIRTRCVLVDKQRDRRLEWTAGPERWKRPVERYVVELESLGGSTRVTYSWRFVHWMRWGGGWLFVVLWPFQRRSQRKALQFLRDVMNPDADGA